MSTIRVLGYRIVIVMTVVIRAKTSITDAKIVYEIAVLGKYFYQLFLNQGCEILKICKLVTMVLNFLDIFFSNNT